MKMLCACMICLLVGFMVGETATIHNMECRVKQKMELMKKCCCDNCKDCKCENKGCKCKNCKCDISKVEGIAKDCTCVYCTCKRK